MELRKGYKKTEVGVIPEDWESKPLKDMIRLKSGFAFSSQYFSDSGTILLTPGNFKLEGGLYFNPKNTKRFSGEYNTSMLFKFGDLLIVMTDLTPDCNLLGKPAFVDLNEPILHNQRIGKIELLNKNLSKSYLYWIFLSRGYLNRIKETATGSTVRHTSNSSIYNTYILIPPTKAEQTAIADALSDADALISGLEKLIAKKSNIKQGTMQMLLTGKKRLPGFSGKWEVKRFDNMVSIRHDRINPKRTDVYEFCVELEHIESSSGQLLGYTSTSEHSSLKSVFCSGDVLFGKLRAYLKKYWLANRSGVCSTEIWVFVPINRLILADYLFQIIKTDEFIEAASTAYGTHMPRSDWNVVKNYEIQLPPPTEQAAIAQVLSDMDAEIDALGQKLNKYKMVKQGMMQELLTGKTRLI